MPAMGASAATERSDGPFSAFKPVEGGYVFQAKPWFFGRPSSYLVDEAQRTEIAERLRRGRRAVAVTNLLGVLMMTGTIPLAWWARARGWSLDALIAVIVVVLLVQLAGLALSVRLFTVRKLRPLLSALPRSPKAITVRDRFRATAQVASSAPLWLWLLLGFAAAVFCATFAILIGRFLFVDPPAVGAPAFAAIVVLLTLPALLFFLMAICFFAFAVSKAKQPG